MGNGYEGIIEEDNDKKEDIESFTIWEMRLLHGNVLLNEKNL
jgi:hypothetical protein